MEDHLARFCRLMKAPEEDCVSALAASMIGRTWEFPMEQRFKLFPKGKMGSQSRFMRLPWMHIRTLSRLAR